MNRNMAIYGAGAVLLGVIGLTVQDFALQWQPVPQSLPLYMLFANLSALILLGGGALLFTKWWRQGTLALGLLYALWALALHGPRVVLHPLDVGIWLGLAEIGGLATAGLLAWASFERSGTDRLRRVGHVLFAACLLVYGTSHFVYADFSATMIPGWLPMPLFWVYLTGSGHIAAGLSLIAGIAVRLSTTLLVFMIGCFVVLLHAPRVIAAPTSRIEWTMLGVSLSLLGAAWIIRSSAMLAPLPTRSAPAGSAVTGATP
jgi:uncharacterized membrane protein